MTNKPAVPSVRRLLEHPIIRPGMDARVGSNIAGPSLIRVPPWVRAPLAPLYLYFAGHRGTYIRLATADDVRGPWRMHEPGVLDLADSGFPTDHPGGPAHYAHIASPDLHVVGDDRQIRMYFHGRHQGDRQLTRVAISADGLTFEVLPELLGPSYFRVFRHRSAPRGDQGVADGGASGPRARPPTAPEEQGQREPSAGWWYALAMPGLFLRSRDGLTDFEPGPDLGEPAMRHVGLTVRGDVLHLFWTRAGDAPEQILHSTVDLAGDWRTWRLEGTRPVLRPELAWEGAGLPIAPSRRGAIDEPVNQLRDPCLFQDAGRLYLLYAAAGKRAIGLAEVSGIRPPSTAPGDLRPL